jgi:PAS domain S-box-containing protein
LKPFGRYLRNECSRGATSREDLDRLPALVLMDRLDVPVLAVDEAGAIVFANPAFAELLGHQLESVLRMTVRQILRDVNTDDSAIPFVHTHAGRVVNLLCARGLTVQARMSASALRRADDAIALVTFLPQHGGNLFTDDNLDQIA